MRGVCNRGGLLLALLLAGVCAPIARAEPPGQVADAAENTVKRLYAGYAWQAIGSSDAFGGEAVDLRRQGLAELQKYFEPSLAALIRKAGECEAQTKRVCTPPFDYIFDAHGQMVEDLEPSPMGAHDVVHVKFKNPLSHEVFRLDYDMVHTADGWRIGNVRYLNHGANLRGALTNALNQPNGARLARVAPQGQARDTPEATVSRLYRDYAWEAITDWDSREGFTGLQAQPVAELEKYFDEGLAGLLRADHDCIERTHDICSLDHVIIFASQDPSAHDLTISKANEKHQVLVTFKYVASPDLLRLRYDMVKTGNGWRIHDIYDPNMKYFLRPGLGGAR
jgi:hypothetical protein